MNYFTFAIFSFCIFSGSVVSAISCNETELLGAYLPCGSYGDPNSLSRVWVPYYPPECTTHPTLPDAVYPVSCSISCEAGYRQKPAEREQHCEQCSAGTFSLGGGVRFDHFESEDGTDWPSHIGVSFDTYCTTPGQFTSPTDNTTIPGCTAWQRKEGYVTSGDQPPLTNSILEISFTIMRPVGELQFQYMSDSDSDNNHLFIQFVTPNGVTSNPLRLGDTVEYVTLTRRLSQGAHKVRFIYFRDSQTAEDGDKVDGSPEKNEDDKDIDIARIDFIQILGTDYFDEYCTPCPPGYYQEAKGSRQCDACKVNTFQNEYGKKSCRECPSDKWSHVGSAECFKKEDECDQDDYEYEYGPCNEEKGTRTKYYKWVQPQQCYIGSIALPEDEEVNCEQCSRGYSTNSQRTCELCPKGSASDGTRKCKKCASGTAAVPELVIDDWSSWQSINGPAHAWASQCVPFQTERGCLVDAWDIFGPYVGTARFAGSSFDLLLQLNVTVGKYNPTVSFDFEIVGDTRYTIFVAYINGIIAGSYREEKRQTITLKLPATEDKEQAHIITWNLHKRDPGNETPNTRVRIYKVVVSDSVDGGAGSCIPCHAGSYQSEDGQSHCIPCEAGTRQSKEGSSSCVPCEKDEFSAIQGATKCQPCPTGSEASLDHTTCESTCIFTTKSGVKYDLSELKDNVREITQKNGDHILKYTISPCSRLPESACNDTAGTKPNAYVCHSYLNQETRDAYYFNAGSLLRFVDPGKGESSEYNFKVVYEEGSSLYCPTKRTTTISYICDEINLPTIKFKNSKSKRCDLWFEVNSPHGCPVCTEEDWEKDEGDCEDGYKQITYYKRKHSKCVGLPPGEAKEACGKVPTPLAVIIVVPVVLAVLILLCAAGCAWFFFRSKTLEYQYSKLKNEKSTTHEFEMQDTTVATEDPASTTA